MVKQNATYSWTPKMYKGRTIPVPKALTAKLKKMLVERGKGGLPIPHVERQAKVRLLGHGESYRTPRRIAGRRSLVAQVPCYVRYACAMVWRQSAYCSGLDGSHRHQQHDEVPQATARREGAADGRGYLGFCLESWRRQTLCRTAEKLFFLTAALAGSIPARTLIDRRHILAHSRERPGGRGRACRRRGRVCSRAVPANFFT